MRPNCLCELINTGMCDGAEKQVICPCHPSNRSVPKETPLRVVVWTVRNVFVRAGEYVQRKARELHIVHTWGEWVSGNTYPVAYPWTRAGCYAHLVTNQVRHCEQCGLKQNNILWS